MEGNNVRLPRESWKVVTDLLPIIKLLAVALEKPPRFYFSAEPAEIPHLVVLLVTTLRSNRRVAAGVKLGAELECRRPSGMDLGHREKAG